MNRIIKRTQYNFRLAVVTIALVLAVSLAFGRSYVFAKISEKQTPSHKYFTSIQIEQGDTLWSIATSYLPAGYDSISGYISEIKQINSLQSDVIHEGQYLMIPYYSDEVK